MLISKLASNLLPQRTPFIKTLNLFGVNYLMTTTTTTMSSVFEKVMATSIGAADKAGELVRTVLKGGNLDIVEKSGANDLQTAADRGANDAILTSLRRGFPGLTVIGEEGNQVRDRVDTAWISEVRNSLCLGDRLPERLKEAKLEDITVWVDPLDGTKEFTEGYLDHVTVLIGVSVGKEAMGGVIHQPFYGFDKEEGSKLGRTFWGIVGVGMGGALLKATPSPSEGTIVTTTRSHSNSLITGALDALKPTEVIRVGGSGHKVILLIEGKAHAYVFPSPGCKKWDTCGPEAILHSVGGKLTDMKGCRYPYNKNATIPDEWGVLATANADDHAHYLDRIPQDVKDAVKDYYKKK